MGTSKSELFTEGQNNIAALGKAFAHPARVAIIQHLHRTQSCVNNELVSELGLAQATISQHLAELKSIGLIKGSIEGSKVNYCIDPDRWNEMSSIYRQIFDSFNPLPCGPDCC